MPIEVNTSAIAHGRSLIAQGKVSHGEWDESKVDRTGSNGHAFAAIDTDHDASTQEHWKFPFISNGKVSAEGVGSGIAYAEKSGYLEVAKALKSLSDAIKRQAQTAAHIPQGQLALLRAPVAFSGPDVQVDEANGVIRNCALMTVGETVGHPFTIDRTTIEQLQSLLQSQPDGVKCRFKHPSIERIGKEYVEGDTLGTLVGVVKNPRIVGDSVRGDVYLGDYAACLPGLGNVRAYLLKVAKENPQHIGLSTVIAWEPDESFDYSSAGLPPARLLACDACDFVGKPAANPNGLLSAFLPSKPMPAGALPKGALTSLPQRSVPMDEYLKSLLREAGCAQDASDDVFQKFHDGLSAEKKAELATKLAAHKATMAAAVDDDDDGDDQPGASLSAKQIADIATKAALAAVSAVKPAKPAAQARPQQDDAETFIQMEAKRTTQISQLGATLKVDGAVINKAIADGLSVMEARPVFLKHLQDTLKPVDSIKVGGDANFTSLRAAIPQAICLRAGMSADRLLKLEERNAQDRGSSQPGKIHERASQLQGMTVLDMFRSYLSALGCSGVQEMSRPRLAALLGPRTLRNEFPRIAMLAESTSDFASITLDAINKTLRFNYLDAQKTWNIWAERKTNPDFKNINRVVLSEAPSMVSRNEGGEIKYVSLSDSKEVYALSEYVAGIKLTRRAIINDDLDAFNSVPRAQANSAARQEDDVAYAILTANANMADGGALFNATAVTSAGGHANLISSGTAISLSSMQIMRQKIKKQKGLAGAARLELTPKFLLVPTSIEATAENFLNSERFVATSGAPTAGGESNPFYKKMTLVPSTRLDDNSATAWYMLADYRDGQINTVEVCFLTDEPEPVIRQETDFDTEDVKYLVRHTVAAKAIDWRGLAKNNGA